MTIDFSQSGKMVVALSVEGTNIKQNKMDATADPGVGDDSGDGYAVGSRWLNVTTQHEFICLDATLGAAVWNKLQKTSEKGAANGYAGLDATSKVPIGNMPDAVVGGMNYQGVWDASTNTPTLVSSTGTKGHFYIVSVAGTTTLDGISEWKESDWVVFNGSVWQKIDNTDSVTSVFGRTAAVVATSGDYTASQVTNAFDKSADDSDDISEGSTNLFMTSAEQSKLSGIEAGADVTDATNVAASGAVMDGDFTAASGFMRKTGTGTYEAIKANMSAAVAPGVGDDSDDGYAVGSKWYDTTADKAYECLDATVGAAVWKEITGVGTGSSPLTTKGDVYTYSTADARLPVGTNGQILSSDSSETTGLKWVDQTIQNISATSISATGNVDTFDPTSDGAVWYDFIVTDGSTNMAVYSVMAVWDDSAGTVQYSQSKTTDIGDTSGITFSVDMDSSLVRLRATRTSGTWNVYGHRRIRYAA